MSRTRRPSNGSLVSVPIELVLRVAVRAGISVIGQLPETRRRLGASQLRRSQPERRPGIRRPVTWVGDKGLSLAEMLEGGDCGAVGDRRIRDPEGRRFVEHLIHRVRGDPRIDRGRQLGPVQEERTILHPLGMPDHDAEVQPLLSRPAPEPDEPVAGGADTWGRDEAAAAHRPAQLVVERHRVVGEAQSEGLEHRHVDQLTGRRTAATGGEGPDGGEEAREPLPDLTTDVHRRPVGQTRGQDRRRRPTTPAA